MAVGSIDWSKPPRSCETCDYPRWHVCLPEEPVPYVPAIEKKPAVYRKPRKDRLKHGSEEFREALRQAQNKRWAKVKEQNKKRDQRMVESYATGAVSMADIQKSFNVSRGVVMKVLREAQERGEIVIRRKGERPTRLGA